MLNWPFPRSGSHCRAFSFRRRWVLLALVVVALVFGALPPSPVAAAPTADQTVYVVRAGDTLGSIAARFGVSVSAIARANNITNPNRIYVGQRLVIPGVSGPPAAPAPSPAPVAGGVYIVQPGDTLAKIAARFGTTVKALVALNNLPNADRIWVGQRLRVSGSAVAPAPAPTGAKWIDVDLSRQRLTAYQGDKPIFTALISGGLPRTPTVVGRFKIYAKYASTRMAGPGYDLPNVPYAMYFYKGYAIHGTYWHNNFGRPMSHGCVNMRTQDAAWLFSWAPIGTPVVTHW